MDIPIANKVPIHLFIHLFVVEGNTICTNNYHLDYLYLNLWVPLQETWKRKLKFLSLQNCIQSNM